LDATRITPPRVASNHVRVRKSANRYNFDSGFGEVVSGQQLMRPRLAFSITDDDLR
jgi:hypothetical protein